MLDFRQVQEYQTCTTSVIVGLDVIGGTGEMVSG